MDFGYNLVETNLNGAKPGAVMKTLLVAAIFALSLGLSGRTAADQDQRDSSVFCGGYLKTDRTGEGIYDRSGQRVGELRQDPLFRNRTNIYDREGGQTGYLEQDRLLKGQTNIYNRAGDKKGYIRQDRLLENSSNIYDRQGDKRGLLRQDVLEKDRTNLRCD